MFVRELKYRVAVLYIVQGRGGRGAWWGSSCSVVAEEKTGGGVGGGKYWREGWCLFVGELNTGKGESGGGGGRRFVAGEAILI